MSGFGRTGKWFAAELHGIVPDMIATAKGITAGYIPLGALIVTDKIAEHFNDRVLWLGLTYSAHPVACAAGLEVMKIYEDENLSPMPRRWGVMSTSRLPSFSSGIPVSGTFAIPVCWAASKW
jgi:taurine--2-oxoglutarate transaminase